MRLPYILFLLFIVASCGGIDEVAYNAEIEAWKENRLAELKSEEGFLNLAGLYWLEKRMTTFGSASTNDLKFPSAFMPQSGSFLMTDENTVILLALDSALNVKGTSDIPDTIYTKDDAKVIAMKNYDFAVIDRAGSKAVRLRNLNHPNLSKALNLEYFPLDLKWRLEAKFVPYDSGKKITLLNIVGQLYDVECPGKVTFKQEDKEFSLDVTVEGDKYFIIFADESNGESTYEAGRYMYVDKEDAGGIVILDFNKSYNPPCVFSDFATCPLPPMQNKLPIVINAGEKKFSWD